MLDDNELRGVPPCSHAPFRKKAHQFTGGPPVKYESRRVNVFSQKVCVFDIYRLAWS